MATTPNGLVYPALSDQPNGPGQMQALAASVDARYGLTVANWAALAGISSPFAGMRVYVTGLGVATYNGSGWIAPRQFVLKGTTESISANTTLQNDDELFVTVPVAGKYRGVLDIGVLCASGQTGDVKFGFAFPTGGTCHFKGKGADVGLGTGTAVGTGNWQMIRGATSGSTSLSYATTSSLTLGIDIEVYLTATQAGTLQMMWAQDVSNSNAAQVLSGSHFTFEHVGS